MINSVSGVNFRGDVAPAQNSQDLINAPGQFATPVADVPADSFEKEGAEKKKSKAPAIIGTIVGLAALAYAGLGLAVGKGKLNKVVAQEGKELKLTDKAINVLHDIGENAKGVWDSIASKFGKKELQQKQKPQRVQKKLLKAQKKLLQKHRKFYIKTKKSASGGLFLLQMF